MNLQRKSDTMRNSEIIKLQIKTVRKEVRKVNPWSIVVATLVGKIIEVIVDNLRK